MSFVASVDEVVCSAHAEMIRPLGVADTIARSLLRTRGDDPALDTTGAAGTESAPHTRR